MHQLKIIIASTRPGRKGPSIAAWVLKGANADPQFNVELVDLAEINLPFLDEPEHPRFRQYQKQHTRDWSKKIDAADAFIIVTSEYNYGFPAPLKNALDYLSLEWQYKPVAFVSYGGISAGTRAVQMLKLVVTALKMVPLTEAVSIPFFHRYYDKEGNFNPDEPMDKSLSILLTELSKWSEGLQNMRISRSESVQQ